MHIFTFLSFTKSIWVSQASGPVSPVSHGGNFSSPSLDPRKGAGALSGSKHGEGDTPSQVPGRVYRRDCPRSLFMGRRWEGCGCNENVHDLGTNPYPPSPLPRTATPWVLPQLAWGLGVGGTGAPGGLTSPLAPGLLHSSFTRSLQCLWQHSPQSGGRQRSVARGPVHVPVLPDCGSWIPNSLTNAPLTPTAVALLGDTPELKRESRTGYLDLGGGLWLGWGDHPGFGNSQGWRLMCDLKIKEIWRFSQV